MITPPDQEELRIRDRLRAYIDGAPMPASAGEQDDPDADLDADDASDGDGPERPAAAAPRLPDWRKGETADLRAPDAGSAPPALTKTPRTAPDEETAEDDEEEGEEWQDVDEPVDEPDDKPATPRRPPSRANPRRLYGEYLDLRRRTRWLLYTGSAALIGWEVRLVQTMNGWITACGRGTSPTTALILGGGIVLTCGVLIDHRTRGWWGPLPWLCHVPLASALLALALYAPGAS